MDNIPGNNNNEKILFVKNKWRHLKTLKHAHIKIPIGKSMIAIVFDNYYKTQKVCNMEIIENEITPTRLASQIRSTKGHSRLIHIWDISNHYTKLDVAELFEDQSILDFIILQPSDPVQF